MNHLLRDLAPVSAATWTLLDHEASSRLTTHLAARRFVDFQGPFGWDYSSSSEGRTDTVQANLADLQAASRRVTSVVELRAPFVVAQSEIGALERGALDPDLADLDRAAMSISEAENAAILHGWTAAGITGVVEASTWQPLALGEDFSKYPVAIAKAVELLNAAGIGGPYGLALSLECYTGVIESTEHGGLIVFEHLRHILDGPIIRTPGLRGAVVMSLRGGDFVFESGQDFSLGFTSYDADEVRLYLEESFTFRVLSPQSALALDVEI